MTDPPRDLAGTTLQAALIGALAAGCFWILRPYLLPMMWATVIVVATWPFMLGLQRHLGGATQPGRDADEPCLAARLAGAARFRHHRALHRTGPPRRGLHDARGVGHGG